MKKKQPGVFLLTAAPFRQPSSWKWKHPRVNLIILRLKPEEYAAHLLRSEERPIVYYPLFPAKIVDSIYWGKCGLLDRRHWMRTRQRLEAHPDYKAALATARRICRGLEQAGHVVLWDGFKPRKG